MIGEKVAVMRRAEDASSGRTLDQYPIRLYAHHMAEIFGVSMRRFYALDGDGHFDFAVNRPRIGRKSYSRDRVRQYFAGENSGLTQARKAS